MTDRVVKTLREARTVKPTDVQQIISRTDQQEAGMREQFEKWAKRRELELTPNTGAFIEELPFADIVTQDHWNCWQAAYRAGAESRWIPVGEHKHEDTDGDSVLFVVGPSVFYGFYSYERGTWYEHLYGKDHEQINVTHWMPLPDPPKEKP